MNQDEIIKEVRSIREQLAAKHNYNVRALYKEAKKKSEKK